MWGNDFADLRRALGLSATPSTGGFSLPTSTPKIGLDYLRGEEGFNPLLQLFSKQLGGNAQNVLPRQSGTINSLYRAAAALDPSMQPDQFLRDFDYAGFLSNLSPFERGERPGNFQRGYRYLSS